MTSSTIKRRHPPMSMTATLTNCYVPLPATSSSSSRHLFDPLARIDDSDGDTSLIRKNHDDATTTATNKTTRGPRTLRRLRLETSILASSSVSSSNNNNGGGSSLVEWGHTKLLVSVRGPRPVTASSMTKQHDGSGSGSNSNGVNMVCEVRYMPHVGINIETVALHTLSHDFTTASTTGRKDGSSGSRGGGGGGGARRVPRDTISTAQDSALLSSGGSPCAPAAFTDETRLSHRLHEALVPAVLLNDTMLCGSGSGGSNKTCIEVFVYILQSDGCVFDAVVTGATLALVNANIPMKDVIVASTAAVVLKSSSSSSSKEEYIAIADPTEEEILLAKGIVTIALMPNVKEVTVFDQFGKMSLEECTRAMELAQSGCATMHKFVKNCLLVNTTSS